MYSFFASDSDLLLFLLLLLLIITYTHTHACTHARTHACMHAYVCKCVYIYIYIYIHMHIAKVPEALHFASAISALGRSSEWERSVSLWQDVKATRAWVSQFGMIRTDLIYIYI